MERRWQPSAEQMRLWPSVSGNAINGRGEPTPRRPSPIFWHPPATIPHGALQGFFYARASDQVAVSRRDRQAALDEPLAALSEETRAVSAAKVQAQARFLGADDVGITTMRNEWIFAGADIPSQRTVIVLAIAMDQPTLATAPSIPALLEVQRQYTRGIRTAKGLASWLRTQGHEAIAHAGPMAGSFVLIPAAIAAGLGELGKHGSLIHPRLGASFRLACVLTDVPLASDAPISAGIDDFCASCRICERACPPRAIAADKQLVRGERRWYVDFDACLPYFAENEGCGICVAACPFSRPIIGERLVTKLERRRR